MSFNGDGIGDFLFQRVDASHGDRRIRLTHDVAYRRDITGWIRRSAQKQIHRALWRLLKRLVNYRARDAIPPVLANVTDYAHDRQGNYESKSSESYFRNTARNAAGVRSFIPWIS